MIIFMNIILGHYRCSSEMHSYSTHAFLVRWRLCAAISRPLDQNKQYGGCLTHNAIQQQKNNELSRHTALMYKKLVSMIPLNKEHILNLVKLAEIL